MTDHRDLAIRNNKLVEMWVVEETLGDTHITHGVHPDEELANEWCKKQQLATPDLERVFTVVPRTRDGWKVARTPQEVHDALQGLDRAIQLQERIDQEIERLRQEDPNITDEALITHLEPLVEGWRAAIENQERTDGTTS